MSLVVIFSGNGKTCPNRKPMTKGAGAHFYTCNLVHVRVAAEKAVILPEGQQGFLVHETAKMED